MNNPFTFCRRTGIFLIWLVLGLSAYAANIEVNSLLSDEETRVGQPVQLNIIVKGARTAEVPRDLSIPDLQVRYVGESVQIQMVNFQVSTSSSYNFVILPLRAGNFTIPELTVKVNGKKFLTKPLNLKVVDLRNNWSSHSLPGGSQQQGGTSSSSAVMPLPPPSSSPGNSKAVDSQTDKLAFGVLILPKKKIYVGEVVPVEIRYYFHPDLPVQSVNSMPSLIGDDFVVQKIPEPQQEREEIKGVNYMVVSFRSSIRPLKIGELQLPATSISSQILTQGRPQIPTSMMPDAFLQRFLDAMPGITQLQKMDVKSEPVTVEVIPLPEKNRPESFRGAIGKFSLSTEVSPRDPSAGDPVTLRAIVSGEGNFDQMGVPELASKQGWQTYPPTSKFTFSDSIGYSGKKTFEWMLVAKENKTKTPELEFSYLNPTSGEYVTLRGEAQAVHAAPALNTNFAPPLPPQSGAISRTAANSISSPVGEEGVKIARNLRPESFQPLIKRAEFAIINGIALLAFCIFLGIQLARYYAVSGGGKKAAWRRSLAAHRDRARVAQGKEFYSAVVDFLRLRAAANDPNAYSGEEVVKAIGLQGEEAKLVLEVFSRYEEFVYGGSESQRPLSAETRTSILRLLTQQASSSKNHII